VRPTARLPLGIAVFLTAVPAFAGVRITYLANEGLHVEGGACDVLIDALQRDSLRDYLRHEADVQEKLETARPPFDRVRLALATHFHLDHWDAGAISRFLTHSPAAVFAGPPQSGAMLPTEVKPRVRPLWPRDGQPSARLEEAGAVVDAIPLDHGIPIEHLAYRLECGSRVLVHLGDAEPSEPNFGRLMKAGAVDVAMVPFWWMLSDRGLAFVRGTWRPRHVMVIHLGARDLDDVARIQARLPEAWIATRRGKSRSY
jgi:L-ascorbate metabolism protein UlaG (beta-lactamase superfamily)